MTRRPGPRSLTASASAWLWLWLPLGACTPEQTPTEEAADESETSEAEPPLFEPPEAVCGNGYLEEGEQCDDANLEDGDGCDSQCRIPCGMLWEATLLSPSEDLTPLVVDLAVGLDGQIVVAGQTDARTSEAQDDVWLGAWTREGEPLWSGVYDLVEGLDDAPAGLAIAPDGAVYLSATVRVLDEEQVPGGSTIWVGRFDGSGALVWSVTIPNLIEGAKDAASGLAITPAGNVVVAGHMRVGEGDSDLWLAELAAADGAQLWSSTWSGELAGNGFSLDKGGPLAIGSDGTIWATAIAYVDFDTFDVHLLSFDPSGILLGDWAPQADVEVAHSHVPDAITIQADGSVYFSISRVSGGPTFWIHRLDPSAGGSAGTISWIREMPSFVDVGRDWQAKGLAAAPNDELFVGGSLNRKEVEDTWYEGWMHRLGGDGEPLCATRHTVTGATIVTPDLFVTAIGASPTGELVAAGRLDDVERAQSFWVGSFRGL